ncbi:MAG: PQQ-dependent sugar dehydrogenase [Akkermansiaceae bacterium]
MKIIHKLWAHRVKRTRELLRKLLIAGTAVTSIVASSVVAAPPADFVQEDVILDLDQPLSMRFMPDERLLILHKKGEVRIADLFDGTVESDIYMDLNEFATASGVNSDSERGLLDIALDPNFPAEPYIYILYTPDSGPNGLLLRVARFTHTENTGGITSRGDPSTEVILWEDTDGYDSCCHYGGGLDFGPDGNLWFTTGDHFQGSYAASLQKAGGGVHRIAKDGSIPATNPYADGTGANVDSLVAYGLRNPFRARWDFDSNTFFIAEVGGNTQSTAWEDLHIIRYDTATSQIIDADFGTAADNNQFDGIYFGWPNSEGLPPYDDFPASNVSGVGEPLFAWQHNGNTSAINGGVVYKGLQFPAEYSGAYFYADSTRDFVRYILFNPDGSVAPNPDPDPISLLNPDLTSYSFDLDPTGRVVSIDEGPDGALYFLSFTDAGGAYGEANPTQLGALRRYVYDGGNQRPVVTNYSASQVAGSAPLAVDFTFEATELEGQPMTYNLFFGDGASTGDLALAEATAEFVSHSYTVDGIYDARLEVSDGTRTTVTRIEIQVGTAPVITSLTSSNDRIGGSDNSFRFGDTMTFSATATDAEDGAMDGSTYSWSVLFVRPGNVHPAFGPQIGGTSIDFEIPMQGQGFSGAVLYRCFLTVTDSSGLATTQTIDISPEKVNITFDTNPSGIIVQVDGNTALQTPFVLDTLINIPHTITVPSSNCVDGDLNQFLYWSNGPVTPQQVYIVPDVDTALTAEYGVTGTCASPPLSGLVMYLNASEGVTMDEAELQVIQWDDQSGSGNSLISAGEPELIVGGLNGKNIIRMDGFDDSLDKDGNIDLPDGNEDRTVIMLAQYNHTGTTGVGWAGFSYGRPLSNRTFGLALTPTGSLGINGWDGANDYQPSPEVDGIGRWLSHEVVLESGVMKHYDNGLLIDSQPHVYNTENLSIRLGAEINDARNIGMDVAEVLVYDRALSDAEREQVELYFEETYGIDVIGQIPPSLTVTSPTNNEIFSLADLPISLSASAIDSDDGDISANIEWSSDIDGALGTGASVSTTLSNGIHTITASIEDSTMITSQKEVVIFITEDGSIPLITDGLVVHLEADLNVAIQSGTDVAAWLDQSGLGNDMISGGGPQFLTASTPSGQSAISFDGNDDKLERINASEPLGGLVFGAADRTMFVVANYRGASAWSGIAYGSGASNEAYGVGVRSTDGNLLIQGWGSGNDLISTVSAFAEGWMVQSSVLDNSTSTLFQDGEQIAQFSHVYATTPTKLVIGEEISGAGFTDMDVAAVLIYDRALTITERSAVDAYLNFKYLDVNGGGDLAPEIVVSSPLDNAVLSTTDLPLTLAATALDNEDGDVSNSITWTSSIDGVLGIGSSLSVSLSEGTHTIYATVDDSMSQTAIAEVGITVVPDDLGLSVTSGLVFHLESDFGLQASLSDEVVAWQDLSSNGNALFPSGNPLQVAASTPSGLASVKFDGIDDALSRESTSDVITGLPFGNSDRTVFMIARYHNASAYSGFCFGKAASNQAFGLVADSTQGNLGLQGWGGNNDLISSVVAENAGWLSQSAVVSDDVGTLFKDGIEIDSFAHSYNTVLERIVIGEGISGSDFSELDVAAVLVYDRALDYAERLDVEIYLQQKYFTLPGSVLVAIEQPLEGIEVDDGASLDFSALIGDTPVGSTITWSSNIDADFGVDTSFTYSDLSVGVHDITATVSDQGNVLGSDTVTVTVNAINQSPQLVIGSPSDGDSLSVSQSINLIAAAFDAEDGNISHAITWFSSIDGSLGNGSSINVNLTEGAHQITATVIDSLLGEESQIISVNVIDPNNLGQLVQNGLVVHLESDSSITVQSGDTVQSWLDQSSSNNDLNAQGDPQLIQSSTPSGLPSIQLDGVNDKLERLHTTDVLNGLPEGNADRSIFVVAKYKNSTAWGGVSYGSGADNEAFGVAVSHPSGNLVLQGWGAGNDYVSTADGIGAGWITQSAVLTGGTASIYKDGLVIGNFAHSYNTSLGKMVVGEEIAGAGYVGLNVAAIIIYDRALNETERQDVETYLRNKYITAPLASTQPQLKISAPNQSSLFNLGENVNFFAVATNVTTSTDLEFSAIDDAHTTNGNGVNDESLRVEESSTRTRISYLKFDLSSLSTTGDVVAASLELQEGEDVSIDAVTLRLYAAQSNNWTEDSITGASAPQKGLEIDSFTGVVTDGLVVEFDLSSYVTGAGIYSFILEMDTTASSANDVAFYSSDSAAGSEPLLKLTLVDPIYSIQWTSDIDGALNVGSAFSTSNLSLGDHLITADLTTVGSSPLNLSDSVNISIINPVTDELPAINGLVLHLESTQNVNVSGGDVTSWLDITANANDLFASGDPSLIESATPSGKPAIRLDGIGDKLERISSANPVSGLPSGNTERTVFVVANYINTATWAGVTYGDGVANAAYGLVSSSNGKLALQGWGGGNDLASTSNAVSEGWLIQSSHLENGQSTLFRDGEQVVQFTHDYNTSISKIVIGEEITGAGFAEMDVAAVLIYDRALSETERMAVENYLHTKYFIEGAESSIPELVLVGDDPLVIHLGNAYAEYGATVLGDTNEVLTPSIVIDDSAINALAKGTYCVTYDFTDVEGNVAPQLTRNVVITDEDDIQVSIDLPAFASGGSSSVKITFHGLDQVKYNVYTSTDLNVWTFVETILGTNEEVLLEYISSGNDPQRFYQITIP